MAAVCVFGMGGVASAASQTITISADNSGGTPTCSVDGGAASACQSSYSVTPGQTLDLQVTTAPAPVAPANTAAPTISGTAAVGDTLTASSGTWSGTSPITYTYQWLHCSSTGCSNIAGATSSTYQVVSSDAGDSLAVVVTATNSGGNASATSAATSVVSSQAPTASFTYSPNPPALNADTTFTSTGSCSATPCSYAWTATDAGGTWSIGAGATIQYEFTEQAPHTVTLTVTDAQGRTAKQTSPSFTPQAAPSAPSNTAAPTISGTAQQGDTLTASQGTWTGTAPISYSYTWSDGTTGQTDTLPASDVGKTVSVTVTATNSLGSQNATSAAVGPVTSQSSPPPSGSAPSNTALPTLGHSTPVVGSPETVTAGSWDDTLASISYQWQQCNWQGNGCADISGATSASYTPVAGDAGHRLNALVTATNSAGSTVAQPTSETQAVAASAFRTFYISISGSDSNPGTKAAPWLHAPGMPGFSGSYTAQTGDHFVFRGGDDFTGDFPITPVGTGTASASYYYGVDPSWYTGSSYNAPTFDDGGSSGTTFVNLDAHSYVEVDGIHFTGFHWTGASGTPHAMVTTQAADVSVTNSLFDGWSHGAASGCSAGTCDDGWGIWDNQGTNILAQGNQFDQSTGSYDSGGAFDSNGGGGIVFDRNTCFHIENCYQAAGGQVSDNLIHDMGFGDFDSTNHQNDIELLTGNNTIFGNVVHDTFYGSFTIDYHASGTNYVYDNVVWSGGREAVDADCSLGGGCGSGTNYLYSNTLVPGSAGTGSCFRFVNRGSGENVYLYVTEDNNDCVGSLNGVDSGASITNLSQATNLVQTSSQASSAGYAPTNQFAPTTSSSPTVGAGTNLTSSCTGAMLALCVSMDDHARPSGSAWDIGAYEWMP